MSLCIYEASYPTALIKDLEDQLGIPLDRIVYLAGTHAAVKVLGVLYESHPRIGKLLFSAPFHRMTESFLIGFGRAIGVAKVEIVKRRRGNGATVTIADPFDLSNCLAIISGILQIADGCHIIYDILENGSPYLVDFMPAPKGASEEEAYQRLFAESLAPGKMEPAFKLPRCRKCGAPRDVGELYDFDTAQGLITERASGERTILMGVHGLNSIIRELSWELGHSVNDLFIAFEKHRLAARLDAILEGDHPWGDEALRVYLAVRGFGMLEEMREGEDRTSFTVHNAFIAPVVAGRLLALWEKKYGRQGSYQFDVTDSTLRFSIS